jgi:ribosomal protein L37AE/L43A
MIDRPAVRIECCPRCGEHRDVQQTSVKGPLFNWTCYKCGYTWYHDDSIPRKLAHEKTRRSVG